VGLHQLDGAGRCQRVVLSKLHHKAAFSRKRIARIPLDDSTQSSFPEYGTPYKSLRENCPGYL
jgi:hypothetical protein